MFWSRVSFVPCASLALFAAVACSDPAGEPVGRSAQRILGGSISPSPEDDAVVFLRIADERDLECSATLVAPNLIVTTLHCVSRSGRLGEPFFCDDAGNLVGGEDGAGVMGSAFSPERVEVRVGATPGAEPDALGAEIISTNSIEVCQGDLAFVVLDRELDAPRLPLRVDAPTVLGERVALLGYGLDESGAAPWQDRRRRRLDDLPLSGIGPDRLDGLTTTRPRTLKLSTPSACQGDSGGPAIAADTGAVIGVFSTIQADDGCGDPDGVVYYTHLSPYGPLVRQAFEAAGHTVWLEGQPDPLGTTSAPGSEGGCQVRGATRAGSWAFLLLASALGLARRTRASSRQYRP